MLFTTQVSLGTLLSGIFSYIHNVRHIEAYFPTFGYILADSGIFRILTQTYLCTLRHIQNPWLIQTYSKLLAYLASFRHYSRAINSNS